MKKYSIILATVFLMNNFGFSQNKNDYEKVYIEVGMLYPLGSLKNKIEPSPNFGFWIKTKIKNDEFFDLGFNLSAFKKNKSFYTEREDSIFENKPTGLSGMVGIRYGKSFAISKNKNISLKWFPSVGYTFFLHKSELIALINGNNFNSSTTTRGLSTFHIGQGIGLDIDNVGIHIQYQFTPYSLFYNDIEKDFGSQSLIFGFVYRQ